MSILIINPPILCPYKPKFLACEEQINEGIFSDITLIVLSSAMNANYEIVFRDCYPMALSELEFDTSSEDVNYLTCMATFKYTLYNINQL